MLNTTVDEASSVTSGLLSATIVKWNDLETERVAATNIASSIRKQQKACEEVFRQYLSENENEHDIEINETMVYKRAPVATFTCNKKTIEGFLPEDEYKTFVQKNTVTTIKYRMKKRKLDDV